MAGAQIAVYLLALSVYRATGLSLRSLTSGGGLPCAVESVEGCDATGNLVGFRGCVDRLYRTVTVQSGQAFLAPSWNLQDYFALDTVCRHIGAITRYVECVGGVMRSCQRETRPRQHLPLRPEVIHALLFLCSRKEDVDLGCLMANADKSALCPEQTSRALSRSIPTCPLVAVSHELVHRVGDCYAAMERNCYNHSADVMATYWTKLYPSPNSGQALPECFPDYLLMLCAMFLLKYSVFLCSSP